MQDICLKIQEFTGQYRTTGRARRTVRLYAW